MTKRITLINVINAFSKRRATFEQSIDITGAVRGLVQLVTKLV